MTRPVVAFFGNMLTTGVSRGALRAFRSIASELAARDDIDLICLGQPVSAVDDPVGTFYECIDGKEFINHILFERAFPSASAAASESFLHLRTFQHRVLDKLWGLVKRYCPARIRFHLRPLANKVMRLSKYAAPGSVAPMADHAFSTTKQFPDTLFRPYATQSSFNNTDIVGKTISLDRVDCLCNFWWFHTSRPNPMTGRYRPAGLRVVSWFLDAIPLRIPHWQPGMIPVMEFRNAVQAHLEAADEIVAISRSAAEDISAYFPHIRKPVHVVPCGIVEADFDAPSLSSSLHADFSIDISMPMFTLIGFHEPSKNVANAISALIDVSERIGREVQAFIIGPSDGIDLYERFGPAAKRLSGRVRIIFGGSVSDTVKRAVLKKSIALIYVSKWEGFGIPPLEAMALGTQVVASDIAPLKEVCGILPEYCDPYDVQDIGAAILRTILKSPEERSAYAERARNHAQSFMWKAAVEKLYRVTIAPASSV